MDEQSRKEAAEIKKLPLSVLEYLPALRWRVLSALIVLVIFLLIFLGLMLNTHIKYARLEAELDSYESLWESQEISNYEYALRAFNDDGISEVAVRVEDGTAISEGLRNPFTGKTYVVPTDIDSFDTVPDLFNRIRKALEDREENGTMVLNIRYDEDAGYPTYIALESRAHESHDVGIPGQYNYRISDFKILEPRQIRYARLEAELDRYQNLWQSKEISGYEYTLKARTDEGYSEVSVRVEDGIATSAEFIVNRDSPLDIDNFDTVPDLFNRIRKALREKEEEGFNQLGIQYNGGLGYPTYIALRDHYKLGDPGKYSYSIIDFKILE